jgi:uncharacterized membrane protein
MLPTSRAPGSRVRTMFRWLLGLSLLGAGLGHLSWARTEFQAQVPPWVPMDKDLVVILSGLVEIGLGAALILPHRRRGLVGWIVAAFFVAVFPGNISQYVNRVSAFGLTTDTARFARLFFQPVLVVWALWSTGAWQEWRASRSRLPRIGA